MDLMGRFFANLPLCLIGLYLIIMLHRSVGQKTTLLLKRIKSNRRAPIKMSTESLRTMILNSEMIIDRSLFIKEVLEHPEKRIIIALPPKWSKSLNLNMMKAFLQVEVDRAGHKVPFLNKTFAYKLFKKGVIYNETQNESLQAPFLISQYDDFIEKHLGQHPVVYMRLKMIEGLNDVAAFNSIKYVISQAFLPHRYLMNVLIDNHKITNENDTVKREKIQSYFFRFKSIMDESETSEEKLTGSLTFLCKLLYRQHRKRIYVLIDDYDVPFYKLLHSEYIVQSDFDHIMKYIEKVISPIIAPDCPYVERVIMTSTHYVTDIMGPNADSMAGYTLANNPWIEYFAITDREQQQLCKEWGKTDHRCRSAIGWYMGYRSSLNTSLNIGSPYSTAHFLAENNIKLYLFYKTRFDYMYSFIRIRTLREIIHSLINNNTVTIESFNDLRFSRADLTYLKEFAKASSDEGIPQSTIDLVLSYLCATGYLTFVKPNATATTAQAWIPNIETQSEMCKKLKPFYHKAYGLTYDHIENVVEKLRDYVMNDDYKHLKAMHQQLSILFNQSGINNVTSLTSDAEQQYLGDLLYAALNYIAIKLRSVWKFDCVVWREGTPPVSYMLGYMQAYGVVIATQHNEEAANLWAMAKKRKPDLQKCPRVQLSKFIGFAIDESKTLHVRSTSEYIERSD